MHGYAYDPALLTDERLAARFCVRQGVLRGILAALARPGAPIRLCGPRGSGRTTLLYRLAMELRRMGGVALLRAPLVQDLGGLWLEVLERLGVDADPQDRLLDRDVREERLFARLEEQRKSGRFVLLIDDANTLAAPLVEALERRQHDAPWLRVVMAELGPWSPPLSPLSHPEVVTLWAELRGEHLPSTRAGVIAALTGGLPRYVAQLACQPAADFGGRMLGLLDANADRFEGWVAEITSPESRRVFLELAALRAPSTAREVAARARFEVNKTSALLGRLVAEGRVDVVSEGRARTYRVHERLLSLYLALRRSGVEEAAPLFAFAAALGEPHHASQRPAVAPGWDDGGLPVGVPPRLLARRRGASWLREALGQVISHEEFTAPELPKKLRKLVKEPEVLLPMLERDGAWAPAGSAALLRAWRKSDRALAARLALALGPWLAATDPLRVACAVALLLSGEPTRAERTLTPELTDPRAELLRSIVETMQGRPARVPSGRTPLEGVLATLLLHHPERGVEALAALERVVREHPNLVFLRSELGRALMDAGRVHEAAELLLRQPTPEAEHFALAVEGLRREDSDGALAAARSWAEAFPGREALAALESLGGVCPAPADALPRLCDPDFVRDNLDQAVVLALELAAEPAPLLEALRSSGSAMLLEPLVLALRRHLGEEASAATEVEDLAAEVSRRARLSSRTGPRTGPG